MNRRDFIKLTIKGTAALVLVKGLDGIFRPPDVLARTSPVRFVFLVDTYKCIGCGFCVKACKLENEIPFDADVSRTWIERYVVNGEGEVFADTPKEARYGFTTGRIDLGRGKFKDIPQEKAKKAFFVPETLQPMRKAFLCPGMSGGRDLSECRRCGVGGPEVVHRMRLLYHGLSVRHEVLPSSSPCGR